MLPLSVVSWTIVGSVLNCALGCWLKVERWVAPAEVLSAPRSASSCVITSILLAPLLTLMFEISGVYDHEAVHRAKGCQNTGHVSHGRLLPKVPCMKLASVLEASI